MAEKYYNISPYAYCANNPVNFVDPDARDIYQIDSSGRISLMPGSNNSNVHQLHLVDGDGNPTGNFIVLSNSEVLKNLSLLHEKEGVKFAESSFSKSLDDLFKIFLFAADNTNAEWALHRGEDNDFIIGTSFSPDAVAVYRILADKPKGVLPIASVHSHTGKTDITTMGYTTGTYSGSDQQSVVNGLSSKYNYVYFPDSHSLYLVGEYYPVYIRKITMFKDFYFGTLNHK